MHLDVLDLRNFYYRTGLGRSAQRAIRSQVTTLWPEADRLTVVGFGFAVPLLRPYLNKARRVIALMPGPQGVMHWPAGAKNVSVLCQETLWPLETGHADRLIVMHGLETSDHPAALLEECWRVLGPGGRALFVVPNRAGLWRVATKRRLALAAPIRPGSWKGCCASTDLCLNAMSQRCTCLRREAGSGCAQVRSGKSWAARSRPGSPAGCCWSRSQSESLPQPDRPTRNPYVARFVC